MDLALLLRSFVAPCESMKSANICFLVFIFVKRKSRTRQRGRAFPDLKVNDYKSSTSVTFHPVGLFIAFHYLTLVYQY